MEGPSQSKQVAIPPGLLPDSVQEYSLVRPLKLLAPVGDGDIAQALAVGELEVVALDRDSLVTMAAKRSNSVCIVVTGQVVAGIFEAEALRERRHEQELRSLRSKTEREDESLLRPEPLARLAKKNMAIFTVGETFNSRVFSGKVYRAGDFDVENAVFSAEPSVVAFLDPDRLAAWATKYANFGKRIRNSLQAAAERLRDLHGVKQEILDFFVRHGVSVAGPMVRVRQLDLCIDCKQCEIACEERYGARRLTLGGYQLGMLDFVYTCRTCTDARCLDPCEYDSIKYDADKGEVVINESTCVGCTLCAQACPYEAIEMIDVEDPKHPMYHESFKVRLEASGSLNFGPGKGRVARPRRIANKCDHCTNYFDQACVSACPTGSLIEVDPYRLFREREIGAQKAAHGGFADAVPVPKKELMPTEPFAQGLGVRSGGLARIRRLRGFPVFLWGAGILFFLAALAEILLRKWAPTSSYLFRQLKANPEFADLAQEGILEKVIFFPGDSLSLWCGYVGTSLMLVAALYPMFRRVPAFRRIASNTMWFDFHMMAGTIGPALVVLHSALSLGSWVAIAFWSMILVVVSGVIGRYLYTMVPDLLNGRALEELEHQQSLRDLRDKAPALVKIANEQLDRRKKVVRNVDGGPGWRVFVWVFTDDLLRQVRLLRYGKELRKSGAKKPFVKRALRNLKHLDKAVGRQVLAPRAQLVLRSWKWIHVPFTLVLTVVGGIHIWYSWP